MKADGWGAKIRSNAGLTSEHNLLRTLLSAQATRDRGEWCRKWSPQPQLLPHCRVTREAKSVGLQVESDGNPGCHGGWEIACPDLCPGRSYVFSVAAKIEDVATPVENISPEVYFLGRDGQPIDWAFIEGEIESCDCVRFRHFFTVPEKTEETVIRLLLRWTDRGRVTFSDLSLTETTPSIEAVVRVAVAGGMKQHRTMEGNLSECLSTVEEAREAGAKLVLLPETIISYGVSRDPWEVACPIPGKETDALAASAEANKVTLGLTIYERSGPLLHNTGLIFNSLGELILKYRKVHMAVSERRSGITPGNDFPVADLPYGRVGMQICYDNVHPEGARSIARSGADLLLLPIMGDPRCSLRDNPFDLETWKLIMRMRALDNHLWLLVACNHESGSCIVNPAGEIVAFKTGNAGPLLYADLDPRLRTWSYIGSDFKNRYWRERRPSTYGSLTRSDFGNL